MFPHGLPAFCQRLHPLARQRIKNGLRPAGMFQFIAEGGMFVGRVGADRDRCMVMVTDRWLTKCIGWFLATAVRQDLLQTNVMGGY